MKIFPVLFLLVLLAACAPAITEVPGPTDAPIASNTPAPTATATLPPSPTSTESPEEAAARLAQNVLDGNITDLSSLGEQQRSAVIEILAEHIPELAGKVIQNQERYAGLVLPLPENLQRAIHLEIAAQINENKTISYTYTTVYGRKLGFDRNRGRWALTEIPIGEEDKFSLPSNPDFAGIESTQLFKAARSIVDPKTGFVTGHERYDYQTKEWLPFDPSRMLLPHPISDLSLDNPLLEKWINMTGDVGKKLLTTLNERGLKAVLVSGRVSNNFSESFQVPTSSDRRERGASTSSYFWGFSTMEVETPVYDKEGHMVGLFVVNPFVEFFGRNTQIQFPAGKPQAQTMGVEYPGTWNHDKQSGAYDSYVTVLLINPKEFSAMSNNSARESEIFLSEMMTLEQFLKICAEEYCDLTQLESTNKSIAAFGVFYIIVEK
jgi:hypothetical protein